MPSSSWARILGTAAALAWVTSACSGDVTRINACLRYTDAICDAICPPADPSSGDCGSTAQASCKKRYEEMDDSGEDVDFNTYIDTCLSEVDQQRAAVGGACLSQLSAACP